MARYRYVGTAPVGIPVEYAGHGGGVCHLPLAPDELYDSAQWAAQLGVEEAELVAAIEGSEQYGATLFRLGEAVPEPSPPTPLPGGEGSGEGVAPGDATAGGAPAVPAPARRQRGSGG